MVPFTSRNVNRTNSKQEGNRSMATTAPGQVQSEWLAGTQAWNTFVDHHPELGLKPGKWGWHNFLRRHRRTLLGADVIRRVRNRFWIAHPQRLIPLAFDCVTGHSPADGQESP
jgi:hypothetical protein